MAPATPVVPLLLFLHRLGGPEAVQASALPRGLESVSTPKALIGVIGTLQACGDGERAAALAATLGAHDPASVPALRAIAARADRPGSAVRWTNDLVSIPNPGSTTAVVAFTGLKHELGISVGELHAQLEPLGCHFVALRDPNRLLFMGPHPALGASPREAALRLREHAERMGAERLVVLGNSGGVVGALLYGALMGADAVVGFGPVSAFDAPFEWRGKAVARRIRSLLPAEQLEPPVAVVRRHAPGLPVHLYFGRHMELDRRHAESLRELPGARLHPVDYDDHDVLRELVARDGFVPEFRGILESVEATARVRAD